MGRKRAGSKNAWTEREEKIKNLILDHFFIDESRSGPEYLNRYNQCVRFLKYLRDENNPLAWLPLDYMTEEEIAEIAIAFLSRDSEHHSLMSHWKQKGNHGVWNYDYFIPEKTFQRDDKERELSILFDLMNKLRIEDSTNLYKMLIHAEYYDDIHDSLLIFFDQSRSVVEQIIYEKQEIRNIGLNFFYPIYIEQYMDFAFSIVAHVLIFLVSLHTNSVDSEKLVDLIVNDLDDIDSGVAQMVSDARNEAECKVRKEAEYSIISGQGTISPRQYHRYIAYFFSRFLERQDYYRESEKINGIVLSEMKDPAYCAQTFPECVKGQSLSEIDPKQVELMITGKNGKKNFDELQRKLMETKKFIQAYTAENDFNIIADRMDFIIPVFRAIFMSKCKYKRRKAMTTLRCSLEESGVRLKEDELLFIETIIMRELFRYYGKIDLFERCLMIITRFRSILMNAYSTLVDTASYSVIRRSLEQMLIGIYEDIRILTKAETR